MRKIYYYPISPNVTVGCVTVKLPNPEGTKTPVAKTSETAIEKVPSTESPGGGLGSGPGST